jgi:hypothetical protein
MGWKFNFSALESDFAAFVANGTKVKILSEIKPPLKQQQLFKFKPLILTSMVAKLISRMNLTLLKIMKTRPKFQKISTPKVRRRNHKIMNIWWMNQKP